MGKRNIVEQGNAPAVPDSQTCESFVQIGLEIGSGWTRFKGVLLGEAESSRIRSNGNSAKTGRTHEKRPTSCDIGLCYNLAVFQVRYWKNKLRGQDLNLRPRGYEPRELPGCSTPHRYTSETKFSVEATSKILAETMKLVWPLRNPTPQRHWPG